MATNFYDIYNVNTQQVKYTDKPIDNIIIPLNLTGFLTMPYGEYTAAVRSQLAAKLRPWIPQPRIFFTIELTTDNDVTYEDLDQIYVYATSVLVNCICGSEPRNEEIRLSAKAKGINLNYSSLLKLVNYGQIEELNIRLIYNDTVISML